MTLSVEALTKSLRWLPKVNVLRGGKTIAANLPVLELVVSADTKAQITHQVKAVFPATLKPQHWQSPLAAYGQQLEVGVEITIEETTTFQPIGVFHIESWVETTSGEIEVSAYSLEILLSKNPWALPSSPTPGATFQEEIKRIASPLSVTLPTSVASKPIPRGITWGDDKLDALAELADRFSVKWRPTREGGLEAVGFDAGVPVAARVYSGEDLALSVSAGGSHSTVNKVSARSKPRNDSGVEKPPLVADASYSLEPYAPSSYGVVHRVDDTEAGISWGVLQSMANRGLADGLKHVNRRVVEIVADPFLQIWDTATVFIAGEVITGRVVALELPVATGGKMRVDIEEELW